MKVQTRLSLVTSIVFSITFAIISFFIYISYKHKSTGAVYENLKNSALVTALFFLEEDELNKEEFSRVTKQFDDLAFNSYHQVYNENNDISYGSSDSLIPAGMLDEIREKQSLSFTTDEFYCYGLYYEDNQGNFIIVAKENRDILKQQLNVMLWLLLNVLIFGAITIVILSRWMANVAYRPFRTVIKQVNNISTHNLDKQIKIPNTKDELEGLIVTFNNLLSKISETFVIQKNFVSYVSHEFKTPLASMMGNLEVFSIKERSPEEYKQLSQALIQQIKQLEETLNTLIIISDLRNQSDISDLVRIDEVIWEIISKLSGQYRKSNVSVDIDILPEDEPLLNVSVERTQLLIALYNLMENAVKYSNGERVDIRIYKTEERLALSITDKGIGIPSGQLADISKPFYRADNTNQIQGSGIGLSIALRILEKNNIKYNINSGVNKGTTVILLF